MYADVIEELAARSKPHVELTKFVQFHRKNPQVLDFLIEEALLLAKQGYRAFSFISLIHYCRWKVFRIESSSSEPYTMNDHVSSWYGRVVVIMFPALNGRVEFRSSAIADRVLGLSREQAKRPGEYARRLLWSDGSSLENGWRPTVAYQPHAVAKRPNVHARAS